MSKRKKLIKHQFTFCAGLLFCALTILYILLLLDCIGLVFYKKLSVRSMLSHNLWVNFTNLFVLEYVNTLLDTNKCKNEHKRLYVHQIPSQISARMNLGACMFTRFHQNLSAFMFMSSAILNLFEPISFIIYLIWKPLHFFFFFFFNLPLKCFVWEVD